MINKVTTKTSLIEKLSSFSKNKNLARDLRAKSRKFTKQINGARNIAGPVTKFVGGVTKIVSAGEWAVNMNDSIRKFVNKEGKELTDYTDLAMDGLSVTFVGGLANDYIYKPMKGIGKANDQINESKSNIVSAINERAMSYLQGNAIARAFDYDLRNNKFDYVNVTNNDLDTYLQTRISKEVVKIDEAIEQFKKDARLLKQKDAVFLIWDVDAGKYLTENVDYYISMLLNFPT